MYQVDIDTVPVLEDCLPVLDPGCHAEAKRMKAGIKKYFGKYIHPEVKIRIKPNPHDFGAYYSIELSCPELNDEACDSINLIENSLPETWAQLEGKTYHE
jgi:hypothetical protein